MGKAAEACNDVVVRLRVARKTRDLLVGDFIGKLPKTFDTLCLDGYVFAVFKRHVQERAVDRGQAQVPALVNGPPCNA